MLDVMSLGKPGNKFCTVLVLVGLREGNQPGQAFAHNNLKFTVCFPDDQLLFVILLGFLSSQHMTKDKKAKQNKKQMDETYSHVDQMFFLLIKHYIPD